MILRPYRTVPARVRPDDQIVGHTGYLIFARAVFPPAGDSAAQQAPSGDSEDAQENLL